MSKSDLQSVKTYPGFWDTGKHNWVNLDKTRYKRYLDLKHDNKWQNPSDPIVSTDISFIEKVRVIGEY